MLVIPTVTVGVGLTNTLTFWVWVQPLAVKVITYTTGIGAEVVLISVSLISSVNPAPATLLIPANNALLHLKDVPTVAEIALYTKGDPVQIADGVNALVRIGVGLT